MKKESRGITLIALVVTIVILIILAVITIQAVFGEGGIISEAKKAGDKSEEVSGQEYENIESMTNEIGNYINSDQKVEEEPKAEKVADLIGKEAQTFNQDVTDKYGNKITIPAGFTIVEHGVDNVVYTYAETDNHIPTVQDGIVIQDKDNNQFVWIPVGKIKNKDNTEGTITLARRTFNTETGEIETTIEDGRELVDEVAKNDMESNGTTYAYKEETIAKDIEKFKRNAKSKSGYYIARYEASKGENINDETETPKAASKMGAEVWSLVQRPTALVASQKMYNAGENFESDLINSYAWDTAIAFIQEYSENKKYSIKNGASVGSKMQNTGTTTDMICNIYDMASNAQEWTTETCTKAGNPTVNRGGRYRQTTWNTSYRDSGTSTRMAINISFRTIIYVQ